MRKNKTPHVWGSFLRKRDIVRYCVDYDIQIFRFTANRNTFLTRFVFQKECYSFSASPLSFRIISVSSPSRVVMLSL